MLNEQLEAFAEQMGGEHKAILAKFRFGKNLIADSNFAVNGNSHPLTTYYFSKQPKNGEQYRITMKAKLGEGKTAWGIFNGSAALLRIEGNTGKNGLFKGVLTWKDNSVSVNNLIIYAFPSAGTANSQIEWIKLEPVSAPEDDEWMPRYDEVIDHGWLVTEVSQMIAGSGNLLDDTLAERKGKNELMIYQSIADVIDKYGLGIYTLSFDIRAPVAGTIRLYDAGVSDDKLKYRFGHSDFPVSTEYKRVTIPLAVRNGSATGTLCNLTFYGLKYGNGVIPHVRRLRISKGLYSNQEWTPSNAEKSALFETLMTKGQ